MKRLSHTERYERRRKIAQAVKEGMSIGVAACRFRVCEGTAAKAVKEANEREAQKANQA